MAKKISKQGQNINSQVYRKHWENLESSRESNLINEDTSNIARLGLEDNVTLDQIKELAKEHFHT